MAREYPRFLFDNPENTKSKGPFVVHLLPPRAIFKIEVFVGDGAYPFYNRTSYKISALEWFDECDDNKKEKTTRDAWNWVCSRKEESDT